MYRTATDELIKWKNSKYRKPLIIKGARQVGKTWLMQTFGQTNYPKVAYINFENNVRMRNLFQSDYDMRRIVTGLQIESGLSIDAETLLILDEVQEVPQVLTSLKYFYEISPEYHILAAGSVLGMALHAGTSFPVGKVDFLNLYPLSFIEFLNASGNNALVQLLEAKDFAMITTFKSKFIDLLKNYYYVGGMPEAVLTFIQTNDHSQVRNVQKRLLLAYEQDFSKHAPYEITPRIRLVWNSFPAQLSKENRKFIYGLVRQGARAREFELALQWLLDSGLVHQVFRVSKPGIPLKAYQDNNAFKLFMVDVGLLGALSDLDAHSLLHGNQIFQEFKGALTEQYVLQQMCASKLGEPFYWSAEKGTAEIDFLIQNHGKVVPIEVKAAENLRAKSLQSFYQQFKPDRSVRSSMSDYRDEGWLINLPLYTINLL
jgi:predicted AAA+ superfamily ATPase